MKLKLKYFIFSNLIIIILTLLFSLTLSLLSINDVIESNIANILSYILSAVSFLGSGLYLGRKIKSKGYLLGIIASIIYLIVVLCLSLIKVDISSINVLIRCICLFCGAIIGVNSVKN